MYTSLGLRSSHCSVEARRGPCRCFWTSYPLVEAVAIPEIEVESQMPSSTECGVLATVCRESVEKKAGPQRCKVDAQPFRYMQFYSMRARRVLPAVYVHWGVHFLQETTGVRTRCTRRWPEVTIHAQETPESTPVLSAKPRTIGRGLLWTLVQTSDCIASWVERGR